MLVVSFYKPTYSIDSFGFKNMPSTDNILLWYAKMKQPVLRKKYPYSELFGSIFSRIRTEYGGIRSISTYLVRMREITDHNNSEYGHFSRSLLIYECVVWNVNKVIYQDIFFLFYDVVS